MDEKRLADIEAYLASQGHRSDPAPNIGLELATALRKAWADAMTVGLQHQDEEDRLTAERDALAMKFEAARKVLRTVEYTDFGGGWPDYACPICGRHPKKDTHADDCALAMVLR